MLIYSSPSSAIRQIDVPIYLGELTDVENDSRRLLGTIKEILELRVISLSLEHQRVRHDKQQFKSKYHFSEFRFPSDPIRR